MKYNNCLFIKLLLLLTALTFILIGCGKNDKVFNNDNGAITAALIWKGDASSSPIKASVKAVAGLTTVRIIVTGAGMSDMQKDFTAADGNGSIVEILSGSNRTVKAQGFDSNGILTYQGVVNNITILAGQNTDVGTIAMLPVEFESEPNESPIDAKSIDIGGGVFKGQLSSAADVDYYKFVSTGGAVKFSMLSDFVMTFGETVRVSIIAQDGITTLASTVIRGTDDSIPVTLGLNTIDGNTYYLKIDKDPLNPNVMTKCYIITPAYTAIVYEFEPNNSIADSNQISIGAGVFVGQLSSAVDVDYYKFISTRNAVQLNIVSDGPSTSGEAVRVTLIDPDGITPLMIKIIKGSDTTVPVTLVQSIIPNKTYYLKFDKDPLTANVFTKSYLVTPN